MKISNFIYFFRFNNKFGKLNEEININSRIWTNLNLFKVERVQVFAYMTLNYNFYHDEPRKRWLLIKIIVQKNYTELQVKGN